MITVWNTPIAASVEQILRDLKLISYLSAGGRGKYIQPGNTKGIMLKEKYIPGKHFLENGMRQAEPRLKTIGESFMQQIGREIEGGG